MIPQTDIQRRAQGYAKLSYANPSKPRLKLSCSDVPAAHRMHMCEAASVGVSEYLEIRNKIFAYKK